MELISLPSGVSSAFTKAVLPTIIHASATIVVSFLITKVLLPQVGYFVKPDEKIHEKSSAQQPFRSF
jgi:hypothetical protein